MAHTFFGCTRGGRDVQNEIKGKKSAYFFQQFCYPDDISCLVLYNLKLTQDILLYCSLPQIEVSINIEFDSFLNKTYCTKNVLIICIREYPCAVHITCIAINLRLLKKKKFNLG